MRAAGVLLAGLGLLLAAQACNTPAGTAPGSITLTIRADKQAIPLTGGTAEIRVEVRDTDGYLAGDGIEVSFFTSLGAIPDRAATRGGVATVVFRSTGEKGLATISAITEGAVTVSTTVTVGIDPTSVAVTASPPVLPTDGGASIITALVTGTGGVPLEGLQVTFSSTAGNLQSGGNVVRTGATGLATDRLTTDKDARVTAKELSSSLTGSVDVKLQTTTSSALRVFLNPVELPQGGGTVQVLAVSTDAGGRPVFGTIVTFTATEGTLGTLQAVTDSLGEARTTLDTQKSSTVTAADGTRTASASVTVENSAAQTVKTIDLVADRLILPPNGNQTLYAAVSLTVTAKDSLGAPVAGVAIRFDATSGQFLDGQEVFTEVDGRALNRFRTPVTSQLTALSGTLTDTLDITVPVAWYLNLSAPRVSVTNTAPPGNDPCTTSANPEVPLTARARLETDTGAGVANEDIRVYKVNGGIERGFLCDGGSMVTEVRRTTDSSGWVEVPFVYTTGDFSSCPSATTCTTLIRGEALTTLLQSSSDLTFYLTR